MFSVKRIFSLTFYDNFWLQEKRHWRRYIYLWIGYALYEELLAEDVERTRQVYQACLELIPHKKFTFAKVWLLFAQFEVRQRNLTSARKILVSVVTLDLPIFW
jgi:crooked neck